jgi:hypothetical protein
MENVICAPTLEEVIVVKYAETYDITDIALGKGSRRR